MAADWDLTALLNAAAGTPSRPERNLWLARLLEWVRRDGAAGSGPTPAPVLRLRQLCQVLERNPEQRERVQALLAAIAQDVDATSLFSDFGFAARGSFAGELAERVRARLLPRTPDTRNAAELFALLMRPRDATWLAQLDEATASRLAALWPAAGWQAALVEAVTFLCSGVRAAGFSSALRLRMEPATLADDPFGPLALAAERVKAAALAAEDLVGQAALHTEAAALRARLARCREAAASVSRHLEEYGVSLQIVFEADQLRARTARIEQLLDCVESGSGPQPVRRLLLQLLDELERREGVAPLFREHGTLLARQIAERSAETGEHYITRTVAEHRGMLRAAAGGGAVIALTTFGKFLVLALGMSAFWSGFWAGANYALSFVVIMLLHWTVATKQPAMTAPAMAMKLADLRPGATVQDPQVQGFVDEVVHLIRSQAAGILGNLAVCFPLVLAIQLVWQAAFGRPLVGEHDAEHVLESITLLGPTALFAALTGVLLFFSSLVAGWVENWFVLHRLDSALAWNPAIVARLGAARAQRWAAWWRAHISGLAANVSLGMMLGLVPVLVDFIGPHLEVRHVTLSTGQLGAALGALGWPLLREGAFWWCVAGIAVTGVLNVGVSFLLALRVAMRARSVPPADRSLISRALWQRVRTAPLSFIWPPRAG